MPTVEITRVDPAGMSETWPAIDRTLTWRTAVPLVSRAGLCMAVLAGTRDLWTAPDWRFPSRLSSVIVTTIVPERQTLQAHLLSGRHIGTWIDSAAYALWNFARDHRCTRIELVGRRGWMKYRHRFGPSATWIVEPRAA